MNASLEKNYIRCLKSKEITFPSEEIECKLTVNKPVAAKLPIYLYIESFDICSTRLIQSKKVSFTRLVLIILKNN